MKAAAKDAGILIAGGLAAQTITFAVSPLLTRLFSPEDFGLLGIFAAVVGVLASVAGLRLDFAIVVPDSDEEAVQVHKTTVLAVAITAIISLLIVLLFGTRIADALGHPHLALYLLLVPLAVSSQGLFSALSQWAARINSFRSLACSRLARSIGVTGIQVTSGLIGLGTVGLVGGLVFGQIVATTLLAASALRVHSRILVPSSMKIGRSVIQKYNSFVLFGVPQALLTSIRGNLPQFMFAALLSPSAIGYYLLAQRVLRAPVNLVGESLRQVIYPRLSRAVSQNRAFPIAWRLTVGMALLTVAPTVLVSIYGPSIFQAFLGASWSTAGTYSRYLVLLAAITVVNIPSLCLIQLMEMQRWYAGLELLSLLLRAFAIWMGALSGSAVSAIAGFVFAELLVNLILIWHTHRSIAMSERRATITEKESTT